MSRHNREQLPPADYLANSYYENWFAGIQKQLVRSGLVSAEELQTGRAATPVPEHIKERVVACRTGAGGALHDCELRPAPRPLRPAFAPGDRVRAINHDPSGHTRAPRYVRGHTGIVREHYGSQVVPGPERPGRGRGEGTSTTYASRGVICGGESANADSAVYVDLWETYLEACTVTDSQLPGGTNGAGGTSQLGDDGSPVFAAPWEASAFALAVRSLRRGLLHVGRVGRHLERGNSCGAAARATPTRAIRIIGTGFRALERLCRARGLVSQAEASDREDAWRRAYLNTPHGKPVELGPHHTSQRISSK